MVKESKCGGGFYKYFSFHSSVTLEHEIKAVENFDGGIIS
jgi:hypothetical protein